MARKIKRLDNITPPQAGSKVTVGCPVDSTYEKITIAHNVTRDKIRNVRVNVNGKAIQEFDSLEQLAKLNAFWKRVDGANHTTLYFARPELENTAQQRVTGIGTADVDTFNISFDIDGSASNPTVSAIATVSANQPLGLITKVKHFPRNDSTAGPIVIDNLPRGPQVTAIHIKGGSIVTEANLIVGGQEIIEKVAPSLLAELQKQDELVPQAGYLHMDFVGDGDIRNALLTNQQTMSLRLELNAAGFTDTIVEYLDEWAGL